MKSNLKPMITLSNINSIPDGHVHSKISFLKSIINEEQNPEMRQMKQRMIKLTYTIKNIGIQGEQIGISSKRVPLKEKQQFTPSEITSERRKQIFIKKYLPQNSFFSQPFVVIKKQKTQQQQKNHHSKQPFLLDASRINQNEYSQNYHIPSESKFTKKAFNKTICGSTFLQSSKFKTVKTDRNNENQERFKDDFQKMKRSYSQQQLPQKRFQNRKSFAKLLNECGNMKKQDILFPIQHQQYPLFKKIKKLKEISSIKTIDKYDKYRSNKTPIQPLSQSAPRYQPTGSIIQGEIHRKALSKHI